MLVPVERFEVVAHELFIEGFLRAAGSVRCGGLVTSRTAQKHGEKIAMKYQAKHQEQQHDDGGEQQAPGRVRLQGVCPDGDLAGELAGDLAPISWASVSCEAAAFTWVPVTVLLKYSCSVSFVEALKPDWSAAWDS